ncbi:hypothetical protein Sros01_31850 [Streptomyces roseochromogenus]|nr:hypothetical protein Sros01_31850 [Streptomyces roseochromogenus]
MVRAVRAVRAVRVVRVAPAVRYGRYGWCRRYGRCGWSWCWALGGAEGCARGGVRARRVRTEGPRGSASVQTRYVLVTLAVVGDREVSDQLPVADFHAST